MRVYGYLRASTKEQDADRAKNELTDFADKKGIKVSFWFMENETGSKLDRPELFRLLEITELGDVLLVEQIDRISRLNVKDWETLKLVIADKGIKIVSLDLPTSHILIDSSDEFTERMLSAINSMLLDVLAAVARKDYEDRRRRQAQGVQKAKQQGKYKGRPENIELQNKIEGLLRDSKSYNYIQNLLGCSRHTISKVNKRITKVS
ncbi:recombinase family protein [Maribacter arcticus]|uniref:Site-specific DNA recombinase n=1 Tax=Maribacter arcticus TaxID=561365 RepID=A0A1T5BCA8_9FLAO|nr:recombinase family protein [Maribacter arcticus]SKB44649.1 Site-specific DNA recombinase [Maribacter arcticus]